MNAQTVKDVCGYLHVWKTRTTPCRPQSDGQIERTIRIVVDLLAKYCSEAQDDWDEYLDSIACAYNSTVYKKYRVQSIFPTAWKRNKATNRFRDWNNSAGLKIEYHRIH